ncbi:MAG: DHCW motif cupin fold protein [Steroidobacteraceae bacterium]
MRMTDIPFGTTDWSAVAETRHPGESGEALWRTQQFGDIRVRLVRYSAGYVADHWCDKGHVLFCMEGDLTTELRDGRVVVLKAGMSYQVADDTMPHRSSSTGGATLFIVD